MCGDIYLNGDIAISKDLYWVACASSANFVEILNTYIATLWEERVDCGDIHSLVFDLGWILKSTEFWKALNERHCATFETSANHVTSTCSFSTTT
jgi:hypothetical protein